jgi:hypothetical protein
MLCCLICGEILCVPEALRDEELANATRGFLEDHIHLHGTDSLSNFAVTSTFATIAPTQRAA